VESKSQQIRWGIMWADKVSRFYEEARSDGLIKPIPYMGNKLGVVLPDYNFHKWFTIEKWET